MKLDRVSICMPVYNGGHYFKLALESALSQDYGNVEIVVVNDGSNDGGETERIATSYGDRVQYIYQANRGVAGALNTAISHMTGDYFAWLSHDDLHLPHKTRAQIEYLKRLGRREACIFSDYQLIGPAGEDIATARLPVEQIRSNPRIPLYNGMINGCTLLIPVAIMKAFGPFNEALRYTQDYELWNRILSEHEFFHQPEVLVQYRLHPGQDSHKPLAVTEGNVLWQDMLDSRSETERAQMFGSTRLYFERLGAFLDKTPYQKTAERAYAQARSAEHPLVSVVIPFYNEVDLALRAVQSALAQVNAKVEVILVDDGSTEDTRALTTVAGTDDRVRLLRQQNAGPAAARNQGLLAIQGDYVAFLDADDTFLPYKVSRQVDAMQRCGAVFSHTSYYVSYPEREQGMGIVKSGAFGGACYPRVIGGCPIATPTVMLHRSVVDAGFLFPESLSIGEDLMFWFELCARYLLLGLDEPLSIVEWSNGTAALSLEKQVLGISGVIAALQNHPLHSRQTEQIEGLRRYLRQIARWMRDADCEPTAASFPFDPVAEAWATWQNIPRDAFGRAPPIHLGGS